jgi:hypothetical protein
VGALLISDCNLDETGLARVALGIPEADREAGHEEESQKAGYDVRHVPPEVHSPTGEKLLGRTSDAQGEAATEVDTRALPWAIVLDKLPGDDCLGKFSFRARPTIGGEGVLHLLGSWVLHPAATFAILPVLAEEVRVAIQPAVFNTRGHTAQTPDADVA